MSRLMSSGLRDQVSAFVKRVKELAEHVQGNEQATKQSLIGPFFTMLGYDLTDPRECVPEHKADFGKDRSIKPIDWGFKQNGSFIFFVEAKAYGKKIANYDEQLADYFAKDPAVKVGILTNGVQWRFFTDIINTNVMDKEPFASWDIAADDTPPHDVLTLLQKAQYNAELIRLYAQRQRSQGLLVSELARLLEPADEFTRIAIANIEGRKLTASVVNEWKPIVAAAIGEWARQKTLSNALMPPPSGPSESASKIVTTVEELQAFEVIKGLLGPDAPIGYEDTATYFKIYIGDKKSWGFLRLRFDRKVPSVWVPFSNEQVAPMAKGLPLSTNSGWTTVTLDSPKQLEDLGELVRYAYQSVKQAREAGRGEGA